MGIEPILPRKLDFESSASTNSATSAALTSGRSLSCCTRVVKEVYARFRDFNLREIFISESW